MAVEICANEGKNRSFSIRKIRRSDNESVAELICTVMPEFGCDGPGYAMADPEVSQMYEAYNNGRSRYHVLECDGAIVGVGGFAPLKGTNENESICELRKMYFLPSARGKGAGKKLLNLCLSEAKEVGYKQCYLETIELMTQARRLYERSGFRQIDKPMGETGHSSCDVWYLKDL